MKVDDPFDLARFKSAQDAAIECALAELRKGRKQTHWMWFVFPQLHGLGRSATAQHYGISSIDEARAYLNDQLLSERLKIATSTVLDLEGHSAHPIFGSPDDLKFHSSMTLFSQAAGDARSPFRRSLEKYFGGMPDARTLDLLRRS